MEQDRLIVAIAKMHGHGRLHIPKEIRELLDVSDGDKIYFIQNRKKQISIKKAPKIKEEKSMGTYQAGD